MKYRFLVVLLFIILPQLCSSQNKQIWNYVDLVDINGNTQKRFTAKSSVMFIGDSLIVVSCENDKLISLMTVPWIGALDDTDYRVFERVGPSQSIEDSVGKIYRYTYYHIQHNNKLVMMVDDSLSFVMFHPKPNFGIVFHNNNKNKKQNGRSSKE